MTDGELVRQALSGGIDAYAELVDRWGARIVALCHAKTGHGGVAEDLAQETLLRGYRSLRSLAQPEKFGSWLYGIALRSCLDWLKAKQRTEVAFSDLGREGTPDAFARERSSACAPQAEHADESAKLMAEVESLPEDYRQVVMLFYYEELTYRDIADLLGVSTATVNARLTKARAMLRERLNGCTK
jgi:RNA polymerase sigma-70 factor, ECF subfamily